MARKVPPDNAVGRQDLATARNPSRRLPAPRLLLRSGVPRCVPLVVAISSLLVAACDGPEPFRGDVCTREERRSIPIYQMPALDVLVVLDRSPSMADQAGDLTAFGTTLTHVLETIEGGVPDLHLAVITSELAATGVAGCDAGEDGAFQGGERCGLDGDFLVARQLASSGGVGGNFAGTLEETIACLVDAPPSTCPVSQPLGAAVRALNGSQPANTGFRRDYAALVVIIVTDGDDCTLATTTALADVSAQGDLEGAIDFACFARGTTCTPSDPSTTGTHTGCVSRADAGIADVGALVAQLRGLVPNPRALVITTVAATGDPVVADGGRLADACAGNAAATAAPRLATVVLPERSSLTSVCGDWSDALVWLADLIRVPLGVPCVESKLDLDPAAPGYQANCVNRIAAQDGSTLAPLPWCDAPGVDRSQPCLEAFVPDPQVCIDGARVEVSLGDERLPDGIYVELRCEVLCE